MVRISSDLFNAIFFSKQSCNEEPKHSESFSAEAFDQNTIVLILFIKDRHWFLAVVDNEAKTIKLYDPAGWSTPRILDIIEKWITWNAPDGIHGVWTKQIVPWPMQENAIDCGMYIIAFTKMICNDLAVIDPNDVQVDNVVEQTGCRHRFSRDSLEKVLLAVWRHFFVYSFQKEEKTSKKKPCQVTLTCMRDPMTTPPRGGSSE